MFCQHNFAQLKAHAGINKTICYNSQDTLGASPSATGGNPPYKYIWQPSNFLNSTTIPNPIASGCTYYIQYTLTVIDKDSSVAKSTVFINIDNLNIYGAGIDTGYCYSQTSGITIGSSNNVYGNSLQTFSWSPSSGLNNPSAHNPIASPSITTIYTLTVSDIYCPNNVSRVKVTAFRPPYTDASPDTTIDQGQTITLVGTGGTIFWWQPDINIKYPSTSHPDVWPTSSITYTLSTQDQHGCYSYDTVRVTVRTGDQLFFYNTFTPNGDGENDAFYIGNLEKYPDNSLKIYNRYGKVIYSATNYDNSWNGTYLGNYVPTGTYYYILNDGKDKLYKGSVTILR